MPAESPRVPLHQFEAFAQNGIVHGVSTRHGGVSKPPYDTLNHSFMVGDEVEHVRENCRRFASTLGFTVEQMIVARQTHGTEVLVADDLPEPHSRAEPGWTGGVLEEECFPSPLIDVARLPRVDIQITNRPGRLLSLRFADCVPVLVADPRRRAVAVAHAGWRGTLRGVVPTAITALTERYKSRVQDLLVGIGPSIGACCYEIGDDVAGQFSPWSEHIRLTAGLRPHLDLQGVNRAQAMKSGVPWHQIESAGVCTRCHSSQFYSHRAEGFPLGRFSAAIGLP